MVEKRLTRGKVRRVHGGVYQAIYEGSRLIGSPCFPSLNNLPVFSRLWRWWRRRWRIRIPLSQSQQLSCNYYYFYYYQFYSRQFLRNVLLLLLARLYTSLYWSWRGCFYHSEWPWCENNGQKIWTGVLGFYVWTARKDASSLLIFHHFRHDDNDAVGSFIVVNAHLTNYDAFFSRFLIMGNVHLFS